MVASFETWALKVGDQQGACPGDARRIVEAVLYRPAHRHRTDLKAPLPATLVIVLAGDIMRTGLLCAPEPIDCRGDPSLRQRLCGRAEGLEKNQHRFAGAPRDAARLWGFFRSCDQARPLGRKAVPEASRLLP